MADQPAPIRVLIADDHPMFRHGMRTLMDAVPDMEPAGLAATGEEAIALAARLQPDVVLMDLQMPGFGGIEATRRILSTSPGLAVLIVTMFEDDYSVFAAMRAGARGYVLKDADEEEILRAIRAVAHGEAIFSPAIARRLVDFFAAGHPTVAAGAFPELSDREREVLALMAQGVSNAAVAERLVLSSRTVRNHITSIFGKLQVADRAEAIVRARQAGLA
jgi:DNA-binding NarL/FixJ family response regulator